MDSTMPTNTHPAPKELCPNSVHAPVRLPAVRLCIPASACPPVHVCILWSTKAFVLMEVDRCWGEQEKKTVKSKIVKSIKRGGMAAEVSEEVINDGKKTTKKIKVLNMTA